MLCDALEDPLGMCHREESLHKTLCPQVRRESSHLPVQVRLLLVSDPLAYFFLSKVPPANVVLLSCQLFHSDGYPPYCAEFPLSTTRQV